MWDAFRATIPPCAVRLSASDAMGCIRLDRLEVPVQGRNPPHFRAAALSLALRASVTWHPLGRRSKRIGEALQTSPIQMRLSGTDTVRQKTSVFICVARLKKVLIELFRHPVSELESLV
jgi:hypothetical protein